MFRLVWTIVALVVFAALVPLNATAQDNVLVVGQHTITVQKSGANDTASVREILHMASEGQSFDGTITFDLDPQASLTSWYITDSNGTPLPGSAGQPSAEGLPSEDVEGFKRFTLDLAQHGVTFEADQTYGVQVFYTLPGDDRSFDRRFSLPTPLVNLFVQSTPGLEPTGSGFELRAVGSTWTYNIPNEDAGPWVPGETLSFTFEEVTVPKTPLTVAITSTGSDPVTLRARADGGIPPYTYNWDTDGDNDCDDAEGQTVTMDRTEPGTHQATVCVTDARGADATVRDTFETRTIQGPTLTTGPTAWLLGLVGLVVGALLIYGLVAGGLVRTGGAARPQPASAGGRSLSAESKDMLVVRQRVMVAGLKELEIAKKKGEVSEGLYTPLKAELKQDTVRVMRELEKRKSESV